MPMIRFTVLRDMKLVSRPTMFPIDDPLSLVDRHVQLGRNGTDQLVTVVIVRATLLIPGWYHMLLTLIVNDAVIGSAPANYCNIPGVSGPSGIGFIPHPVDQAMWTIWVERYA